MISRSASFRRRNFLASSARITGFSGAMAAFANKSEAASASIEVQSASGENGSTSGQQKQVPMPRTAPPYDKAKINLIGPKPGYSPQVGTLVTMLTWMELAVLQPTRGLRKADLDFLLDKDANTIGALMLHLAATEVLYQRITFNGEQFEKLPRTMKLSGARQ